MSDVRVPDEKEFELAKRRPSSANNFRDLYASGGSSQGAVNPYSLMSDFIEEAFADGRLDDNEVAGMKTLAGLAPSGGQPAPAAPAEGKRPSTFERQVDRALDRSNDWDSGEQKVMNTAERLFGASSDQQWAFMEELWKLLLDDGDIDESRDGEARELDSFVDGLLGLNPPAKGSEGTRGSGPASDWQRGQRSAHGDKLVHDYLRGALRDGKLSDQELDGLRLLLDKPVASPARETTPTQSTHRPDSPRTDGTAATTGRHNYSSSSRERSAENLDWLVSTGGISRETAQGAKELLDGHRRS